MNVVLNVLDAIAAVLGFFPNTWSLIVDILGPFGLLLFVGGFIGLLITFLWFFFRYLDQKRLVLPALVFTLFFLVFLSGNILMIAHYGHTERNGGIAVSETSGIEDVAI